MTAAVAYRSNAESALRPVRQPNRRAAGGRSTGPQLRVLDQAAIRRRARRRNAAILLFLVLLGGLFVVAFVHAHLVATQQDLDQTRADIAELRNERARLERAVDEASSPALIVERAAELGMVRAAEPVFLVSVEPGGGASPAAGTVAARAVDPAGSTGLADEAAADAPSETAMGGSGDG